jgi:cytochrome c
LTAEKNKIGPHMVGLFGRKAGSVAGFKYSPQMQGSNVVWDEKTIDTYITDPKKFIPGNKMVLAPIKDAAERADIIAYLKQQQKK